MRKANLYIILSTIIILLGFQSCSSTIEYEGVEVSSFDVPDNTWHQNTKSLYTKNIRSRYFDYALFDYDSKTYIFIYEDPERNDFTRILMELEDEFGDADENLSKDDSTLTWKEWGRTEYVASGQSTPHYRWELNWGDIVMDLVHQKAPENTGAETAIKLSFVKMP